MPRLDHSVNLGMEQTDATLISRRMVGVEHNALPYLKAYLPFLERTDAQLRPLEVREDGDRPVFEFKLPERGDIGSHLVMARMAHIDAEDIGARFYQLFKLRRLATCWPDGCYNLRAA